MEEFNIHNKLPLFDQRLTQIKPPDEVTRSPRSYQKFSSDWKLSDYRNFISFYDLPILADILPNNQLSNFTLLVHSMFILLQKSISHASIESAENMLMNVCNGFRKIYGDRYMSANIHQLLYLCDNVNYLGPLWTHSCFPFEDKNRFIVQMIHGSQKIAFQIASAVNIIQSIPEVVDRCISKDPLMMHFYQSINRQKCFPVDYPIGNESFILGKVYKVDMTNVLFDMLSKYLGVSPSSHDICKFDRMILSNEILHAKSY